MSRLLINSHGMIETLWKKNPSAASGKASTTMDSPKFEEAATDFTERGQGRSRTDGGWKKMAGFDGDFDGLRKNWN